MANKRMFTMHILDSDAFLDMPLSTQCLYFHLNMRADDDGFIGNPKRIQRLIGSNDDDLKLLIAKRFVLAFDDGVMVIKHWRMHNTIRGDRYTPTAYQEELSMLLLKDNKSYSLTSGNRLATKRQPNDCHSASTDIDIDIDKGIDIDKDKDKGNSKQKKLASAQTYFPNDEILNETFIDFINMRKTLKNGKMTDRAITMMINKLNKYDVNTAITMLEQSILNNWKDVYELKGGNRTNEQARRISEQPGGIEELTPEQRKAFGIE